MNSQKNLRSLMLLVLVSSMAFWSCNKRSGDPKVLVFSKTAGFYHESIPSGIAAIQKLGEENGFEVDTTTQATDFNEENLTNYSAVIFLSTTGDVLDHYQEAEFERYIQAGGGFVGVHAAADTEYEWGWYNRLVGGYFADHPGINDPHPNVQPGTLTVVDASHPSTSFLPTEWERTDEWYNRLVGGYFADHPGINDPHPNVQPGTLTVVDASHPSTSFLPTEWERTDEWYSYKQMNPDVNVLITLDEDSYQGGLDMGEHPAAWYHDFDGGRSWYTAGGHTDESYQEENFLKHLLAGIEYAIGDNENLDFTAAKTKRVPAENRFTKTMLSEGQFTEPTEMTILPNLDILIAQRRGELLLYKNDTKELTEIAKFDVYWKTEVQGVNAEEGLMGLQKDPNFEENGHVFAFYAPSGEEEINRLSRFTFKDNTWDMSTEEVILELYSQRGICCHTGGSIAFDKDGLLYLSTGDNSTPFNQDESAYTLSGFAPLDQREGREQWDARRSAGNANDLRGKILRIKVNEDGSYDIPEGNLYPEGTEGTRPEIFVQGNRNPYRISVDQKTGFLYWGEVGPDASADSLATRGPRGYDEVNQAREAGNFGWPYFIGDNYAYREYDFVTGTPAAAFDPANPMNTSVNNTGATELPAAKPAFIWYPYANSTEFPQLGTGGRNAMAGPVYYPEMYPEDSRFPDYYEGKLFIYDWIRGWIKAVTMKENGDFDKMEPFMPSTKFNAMIDMEMGPDGKIYILEYGNGWFTKNSDSGLSRIDFNGGNRAPIVSNLAVDKTSGKSPLNVTFTAVTSDPENDPMSYTWDLGNGETKTTEEPSLTHTFNEIGEYSISVTAEDPEGLNGKSSPVSVYVGNIAPEVTIKINGNQSFYFPGQQVSYEVSVQDEDHPNASEDLSTLYVSADYTEGLDQAEADMGHQVMSEAMTGKSLVSSLTCKTCHKEDEASIGPAYTEVAKKYTERDRDYLANKIKNGGGGVWGETVMPANPDLKDSETNALVSYVLSLDQETVASLPASGTIDPTQGKTASPTGMMVLTASYTDQGGENIKPLSGSATKILSSNTIDMIRAVDLNGFGKMDYEGQNLLSIPSEPAHFALDNIDLSGVGSVSFMTVSMAPITQGVIFEIHLDSPDGPKVGEGTYEQGPVDENQEGPINRPFSIPIAGETNGNPHKLYITSKTANGGELGTFILAGMTFNPN